MTAGDPLQPAPVLDYGRPKRGMGVSLRNAVLGTEIAALPFAAAGLLLMLWGARLPVSDFVYTGLGNLCWLLALATWLCASVVQAILYLRRHGPSQTRLAGGRTVLWLLPLALFLITCGLLWAQIPRRVMFAANRPAMDAWVRQVLASSTPPPSSATIGAYEAYQIEPIPRGLRFLVHGCGFMYDSGGFAYSPDGPPPPSGAPRDDYTPVGGGWYIREYGED